MGEYEPNLMTSKDTQIQQSYPSSDLCAGDAEMQRLLGRWNKHTRASLINATFKAWRVLASRTTIYGGAQDDTYRVGVLPQCAGQMRPAVRPASPNA